ncbi:phosphatase [Salmonella enterica subsp. enterica]|uniref:Phosphatase n=1 Tax=Salmonella enterica I TaxID=59201 RepID=A0A7Z1TE31_SALET|nr:HAD-IA family hydrolase [Salmonella enterica]ECO9393566.1 HAD-IA family hydrolase [Salmonella enterica]PUF26126.1 phosphatase [Salmonella enterica subsp. enterica]PUF50564.1 phosphatase [Salmonella enterica subsp. enterica]
MIKIECKAILFDLDGTLVDSGPCIERLWACWASENHLDVNYVLSVIHGRTVSETLRLISPYFHNQECIDEIKVLAMEELSHVSAIPGAIDFVKRLPADRQAIVTSGAKEVAMRSIMGAGISAPNVIITAEDVHNGKPDPEPYLKAAARLGMKPADCLVFEDAESGIKAAVAAGMHVVVIGNTDHSLLKDKNIMQLDNYTFIRTSFENDMISLEW